MMIVLVTASWKQRKRAFWVEKGNLLYIMSSTAKRWRRMRIEKRQGFWDLIRNAEWYLHLRLIIWAPYFYWKWESEFKNKTHFLWISRMFKYNIYNFCYLAYTWFCGRNKWIYQIDYVDCDSVMLFNKYYLWSLLLPCKLSHIPCTLKCLPGETQVGQL